MLLKLRSWNKSCHYVQLLSLTFVKLLSIMFKDSGIRFLQWKVGKTHPKITKWVSRPTISSSQLKDINAKVLKFERQSENKGANRWNSRSMSVYFKDMKLGARLAKLRLRLIAIKQRGPDQSLLNIKGKRLGKSRSFILSLSKHLLFIHKSYSIFRFPFNKDSLL